MRNQELVIGCGPVGRAVLRQLKREGITAVSASRNRPDGLTDEWQVLDASRADEVAKLTRSFSTVYLCAAPPLTRWSTDFEDLVNGVLTGLEGSDTNLVFASNLYSYGRQAGPITEVSKELATGSRGRLRGQLDRAVLDAATVRTAVVRASSFFGPEVPSSLAGSAELQAMKEGRRIPALGSVDQPHTMTYIDDFARALVNVAHDSTAHGRIWHAPMQPPISQREILEEFGNRIDAKPTFRMAGSFLVGMLGLFSPTMRALQETFYTHSEPFVALSDQYNDAFNDGPTALNRTIEETLRSNNLV